MRTASTLCATGAGIGVASIGLAVVREESPNKHHHPSREPSPAHPEMTAVASYPHLGFSSPLALSNPQSARSASEGQNGKARSAKARVGQKRSLTPGASFGMDAERALGRGDETGRRAGTPNSQHQTWLRRLSSNVSTSRDSSQTPASRPGSAAISQSNGSVAFSQAGSTTPMFPDTTPSPLPPNKLVKRTSSLRSTNGSPFQGSGSRLPIPVFRRPATSHQRSATLHDRLSGTGQSDFMSLDGNSSDARDPQLRQYFTPRFASADWASRRRSSSGIPNPIKRVYPDRKHTPMLVPASPYIKRAQVFVEDEVSSDDDALAPTESSTARNAASSPLSTQIAQVEEGQTPRRSFSIGDLLSTGPQPLWRRPSQSRGRNSSGDLRRKGKSRVVSAPLTAMGNSASTESERPAKRRDLTNPQIAPRSIYSSSSSTQHTEADQHHEIQLNIGAGTPRSENFDRSHSPFGETSLPHPQSTAILEQNRLPSATLYSTAARPARLSAAQSEIVSTIGSDSEYQSIGDASTDYQSDTVYDSYRTQATRSSSGRRGPHINKIFDDSPPNFSSGRSTKLTDLLNDGTPLTAQLGGQYRHSTIEEEESIISTPVRSIRDNSVTSTPSARPGAQQSFTSSPPVIPHIPDTDEIDWDVSDDEFDQNRYGPQEDPLTLGSYPVGKSLPFRFGPALRQPNAFSTNSTPLRSNGSNSDKQNVFDWSETQPSPSQNHSPPRPRTVHGKKDPESRGSRAGGRRAPSGMHARSHSVPVVPDVVGRKTNVIANKFGTWGVGSSKPVTEDWGDDFDFDELPAPDPDSLEFDEERMASFREIRVPQSIREQQEAVVANIGLLRDWGILIEELKELRIRAGVLGILHGRCEADWKEVDAMIELADQETEEVTLEPRRSPPSSPNFDYGAFEDSNSTLASTPRARGQSITLLEPGSRDDDPSRALNNGSPRENSPHPHLATRPRKDSEAVARTVIEALQAKRSISDPTTRVPIPHSKKVPFDTATLRHIVPYVHGIKRRVKEELRETEGLRTSPHRRTLPPSPDANNEDIDPPFRTIFNKSPSKKAVVKTRSRRIEADTDHDGSYGPSIDQNADLSRRMQNMKLPR